MIVQHSIVATMMIVKKSLSIPYVPFQEVVAAVIVEIISSQTQTKSNVSTEPKIVEATVTPPTSAALAHHAFPDIVFVNLVSFRIITILWIVHRLSVKTIRNVFTLMLIPNVILPTPNVNVQPIMKSTIQLKAAKRAAAFSLLINFFY